jgi:hypothetical protein
MSVLEKKNMHLQDKLRVVFLGCASVGGNSSRQRRKTQVSKNMLEYLKELLPSVDRTSR